MGERYKTLPRFNAPYLPPQFVDLIRRRTQPLLDYFGLSTRPVGHLLEEAYLQGFTDAIAAMTATLSGKDTE